MPSSKRSTLILGIYSCALFVFGVGTILFFKNHYENAQLKTALETAGILTTGYVLSKNKDTKRSLSASDFKWQYSNDYMLEYHYLHNGQAGKDEFAFSLKNYLEEDSSKQFTPTTPTLENLGRIELKCTIGEELFDKVQPGSPLSIVYLYQQPKSARILYPDHQLSIPNLQIFAWISLLLSFLSAGLLRHYWKTGISL